MTATGGLHVALLRGINVGGKNMLKMDVLAAIFVDAGCGDVRTYIQSGNVVFRTSDDVVSRIPKLIADRLEETIGIRVPLVTRTAAELGCIAAENPFLDAGCDPKSLAVGFLADLPSPKSLAELDPERSPGDEFAVRGREIFLHLPNGAASTKLTNAYFDSKLRTTTTFRNWRTVLKLVEMSSDPG